MRGQQLFQSTSNNVVIITNKNSEGH